MPHAESGAEPSTGPNDVDRHLTESVLTLQQAISNIQRDVANNIAPSILLPTDPDPSLESGMVFLQLDPSASTVETHIGPLDERLRALKKSLVDRKQWHPPPVPPKSPEYSIIDINDLKSAIRLLEEIYQHSHSSKPLSPQPTLSCLSWKWDPIWKEYYAENEDQTSYIYLSRWRLDEQRQVWEHVTMNGAELEPETAAELLGSWDDWIWDPLWKQWHLDVSGDDGKMCVFASRWQVQESGEWVYVGRVGNSEV